MYTLRLVKRLRPRSVEPCYIQAYQRSGFTSRRVAVRTDPQMNSDSSLIGKTRVNSGGHAGLSEHIRLRHAIGNSIMQFNCTCIPETHPMAEGRSGPLITGRRCGSTFLDGGITGDIIR